MASESWTEDKLLDGRVTLLQPRKGYRVAIDPVLLAAAVPARLGDHVLDLGSGTGAASLCLAARLACTQRPVHLRFGQTCFLAGAMHERAAVA